MRGFISFAFGPDLLSRFINFTMWSLMTGLLKGVLLLPFSVHAVLQSASPNGTALLRGSLQCPLSFCL